jgi:hypothetical protein
MGESAWTFVRRWSWQVSALAAIALTLFWGLYWWDLGFAPRGPFERYLDFDAERISDAISSLAGLIAAVFGIVITVVSIIVQLSADRFTGVTRMFFRDRLNLVVMAYYIVVCVYGVWLAPSLNHTHVPTTALVAMLLASTVGLAMMGPYFAYVFWFLEPINIIERVRKRAERAVRHGALHRSGKANDDQAQALHCLEELTDITSNSISGKDKIIASGAVDALKDFAVRYIEGKRRVRGEWFKIGPGISKNPDFVAMDAESLRDLEERHTWVEWKVMRQYLGIYNEALGTMRDINYLIAIDTRYLGEAALEHDDPELLRLVFRYMNSYLRATINAKDVRTAYNVLNQYRKLVEVTMRKGKADAALEGVGHMKYYGHVSYGHQLSFITETVAYDVSALCEVAHDIGFAKADAMLHEFLDLDRPEERALIGVRKAQVKLACYYLARGEQAKARSIADDMREDRDVDVRRLRKQLQKVKSKDFWEIIDRGRNFEYMPDTQRAQLGLFFEWLEEARSHVPRASS